MALTQVSIIEDDEGFANALATILNGTPGFRCLSTHGSGEEALEALPFSDVDVVLVDLGLPRISGVECIRRLRERSNKPLFMVLTVHEDTNKIFDSLKAGASAYITKKTPPAEILEAITELVRGGSPMSPPIARKVAQFFHSLRSPSAKIHDLSDREREVLHEVSQGNTDKEIAKNLGISVHTVGNHVKNIYGKLHVHSRTEATAKYLGR